MKIGIVNSFIANVTYKSPADQSLIFMNIVYNFQFVTAGNPVITIPENPSVLISEDLVLSGAQSTIST